MDPRSLRYTKTHEWARLEGDVCTVGITTFAAEQLTDITYLELPNVGEGVSAGKSFGTLETVKAASDLYSPVDGEVSAVNKEVQDDHDLLTREPLGGGWLIKVKMKPGATLDH